MITTILFDLGNVYIRGLIGTEKYLKKDLGFAIPYTHLFSIELEDLFLGKISEEAYWDALRKRRGWDISTEKLKSAARENFKEINGTREIIEKLKENGYTLVILSNHTKEWVEYCERKYKYHKLFKNIFYSYKIGFTKPRKEIFTMVLQQLNVNPRKCLFIDDNKENVIAASNLNIQTIQFTTAFALKKALQKFGIRL